MIAEPAAATARVALVTGGAVRIGAALAWALAEEGWAVAIHHRSNPQAAAALAARILAAGGRATVLEGDLEVPGVAEALVARAARALGPVSLLVANASRFVNDRLSDVTRAEFQAHMAVNLWAPLALAQGLVAQLPAGVPGQIVTMLDSRLWHLRADFLSYTLAKAGLATLTQVLARSLAPQVRVNALAPGQSLRGTRQSQGHFDRARAALPLGTSGEVGDLVAALRYLVAADAVTGQVLFLDGGDHLGPAPA